MRHPWAVILAIFFVFLRFIQSSVDEELQVIIASMLHQSFNLEMGFPEIGLVVSANYAVADTWDYERLERHQLTANACPCDTGRFDRDRQLLTIEI